MEPFYPHIAAVGFSIGLAVAILTDAYQRALRQLPEIE